MTPAPHDDAREDDPDETLAGGELGPSLRGTFVIVLMMGAFFVLHWAGFWYALIERR